MRQVGGPDVMRGQLSYLAEASGQPGVVIQVLPLDREYALGAAGSFAVPRSRDPELRDVVYIENLTVAVFLDSQPDVERYLEALDNLAGLAETPSSSSDILRGLHSQHQVAPSRRRRRPR
jgi:hypothetical protein